jgi:hypothetical protein
LKLPLSLQSWRFTPILAKNDSRLFSRPDLSQMTLWRLPEPQFKLTKADGGYVWQETDAYGLIPCAGQAQSQRSEQRE